MSTRDAQETVLERIGYRLSAWVERWMPSPFLFALILSYVVFLAGVGLTGSGPIAMLLALTPFLAVVLFVLPY